jgi:hypothetical protein
MPLVFLGLAVALLWINLAGAGLAARRLVDDFPVAVVSGAIAFCLACFFLEHFAGWGPHPPLLPFTAAVSIWMIWRDRRVLRRSWKACALFAAGFCYCLAWRYTSPDIDFTGEKMPNLMLIEGYMRGTRLPPPDLWLAPFRANFYYSFQHYGAAMLGRLLGIGPGVTYQLAYCTLVGFITLLMGSCVARFCAWRPGRLLAILSLLLGGSGSVVAAHALLTHANMLDDVRFLGTSLEHHQLNALGARVASLMAAPGQEARDLPMEPMSYVLVTGDYHPPLAGYLLLALASTLIAAQATGASGFRRKVNDALLAATPPVALISDAWVFPLLCILVGGWFAYRLLSREPGYLLPALAGLAAACLLEYPYLVEFTQQSIGRNASISLTPSADRTPFIGWCLTFWPVAGILALGLFNREGRSLTLFLIVVWAAELAATEFLFDHDLYGGVWNRFNSTLKWWGWVYAGIVLTLGARNLGSGSRLCRYGTALLLLPCLIFGFDLYRHYESLRREDTGNLTGSGWVTRDPVVKDLIAVLALRPDGITLESGIAMENTMSPAVTLFSGKESLLGWPWHETTWRGSFIEIRERLAQINDFYSGRLADPLHWLLANNVRYVLWLAPDCAYSNTRFQTLSDQIKARYFWQHLYGDNKTLAVGFWERVDGPPAPGPAH